MRFPTPLLQQCWFLAGPTACGKTATGIALAERIGAEIVCLDSMTIYRGMDIGTAKPTADERARVPHHVFDIRDPHQEFSATEYMAAALDACQSIVTRGRIPLFVGGTGLYLRAVLENLTIPEIKADLKLRAEIEKERVIKYVGPNLSAATDRNIGSRLSASDQLRAIGDVIDLRDANFLTSGAWCREITAECNLGP